jgi:hypothetical protein
MKRPLAPLLVVGLVSHAWADSSGEIGATAIGEGSDGDEAAAFGAMRLAGTFRYGYGTADVITSGVDGQLVSGDSGAVRGTHWLRYRQDVSMRHTEETGKPAPFQSWVEVEHRFDYEERAALSRRRDLVRGRHTGEHAVLSAVMAGDDDPRGGGAFLPFSWELDFVGDPAGGADVLNRFRISLGQWWDDDDGDGDPHVREVFTVDSYLHDREKQGVADTIIVYAERGRPLRWQGWVADFRLGFATNTGETTLDGQKFVNERHPDVSASINDGALRWRRGRFGAELRYDRALYLTMDTMLALEDRLSTRATWTAPRLAIESSLFAARTRLWADRRVDGERHLTDGISLRALTTRTGLNASATVEVGRSFYADAEAVAMAPTAGWRATIDLTRRWGSIARP